MSPKTQRSERRQVALGSIIGCSMAAGLLVDKTASRDRSAVKVAREPSNCIRGIRSAIAGRNRLLGDERQLRQILNALFVELGDLFHNWGGTE